MLDMDAELTTVSRLRRLLEPLAVLYEKVILDAGMESYEISLRVQRTTVHLGGNDGVAETVHIINGETLQAAYEVWQEYRRTERALLDQSRAASERANRSTRNGD